MAHNRKINEMFDMIINKDLFDYSNDNIYASLIKSFINQGTSKDVKPGETIIIISENVLDTYKEIKFSIIDIYGFKIIDDKCSCNESIIELDVIDINRKIRIIIKDIEHIHLALRGYRAECVVIDVYEDTLENIKLKLIRDNVSIMNTYRIEDKPCHGIMMFYSKRI